MRLTVIIPVRSCPRNAEQLEYGLEDIRAAVGPAAQSGLSDAEIKDALYHYYFDIQQSLDWLLSE